MGRWAGSGLCLLPVVIQQFTVPGTLHKKAVFLVREMGLEYSLLYAWESIFFATTYEENWIFDQRRVSFPCRGQFLCFSLTFGLFVNQLQLKTFKCITAVTSPNFELNGNNSLWRTKTQGHCGTSEIPGCSQGNRACIPECSTWRETSRALGSASFWCTIALFKDNKSNWFHCSVHFTTKLVTRLYNPLM